MSEEEVVVVKKKKKKAVSVEAAPKKKKKKKAVEAAPKKKAEPKASRTRVAADLSSATLKLIAKADLLEERIIQSQADLQEVLGSIAESAGACTFEHPVRGPMTIMVRGEKTYWRGKPSGAT